MTRPFSVALFVSTRYGPIAKSFAEAYLSPGPRLKWQAYV